MILDNLKNYHIILGSQSPRRKELLGGLDIEFEVMPIDADEQLPKDVLPADAAGYLAKLKAAAYSPLMEDNTLLITADTIVLLNDQVLGKPIDRADAINILQRLSGNTHQVITGVCITTKERQYSFQAITEVRFARLSLDVIEYYVDQYKPYDKAGAYGVQEWIGFVGVEHIQGSYFNVMGLPIQQLYQVLKVW